MAKFKIISIISGKYKIDTLLVKHAIRPIAKNLSATASNLAPIRLVTFHFLANQPSKKSVNAAIMVSKITSFMWLVKPNTIIIIVKTKGIV